MLITLDIETYWDTAYTLSKMTTEAYVRSPQFKLHMIGIKIDDRPATVLSPAEFYTALSSGLGRMIKESYLLCQNTVFDGFFLAHHCGLTPKFYLDTMSMFRMLHPDKRASLKVISETLGLKSKGGASGYSVVNTRGKTELTPAEWEACAEYCKDDVDIAYDAFQILKSEFPIRELRAIDSTIRMFTQPVLRLDPVPLIEELEYEKNTKQELLARIGEDKTVLASSEKFSLLLQSLGVTPPVKPSPTAIKKDKALQEKVNNLKADGVKLTPATCEENEIPWSWAFGKSDVEFKHLLNHDDPMVVAAVEARLGVKSTIGETRAARFLDASTRGDFPIPLLYWGAATGRYSGKDYNLQNLPRGEDSRLRKAITAPPGHLLCVVDYSSVEARCLAWVAGQDDLVDIFRSGGDVYCDMASKIYGRRITKQDKKERQLGKTVVLGSGYAMSWRKFQEYVVETAKITFTREDAAQLGVDVGVFLNNAKNAKFVRAACPSFTNPVDFAYHCAVSEAVIKAYRSSNHKIVRLWESMNVALRAIYDGMEMQIGEVPGLIVTCEKGFALPHGRMIRYHQLTPHQKKNRIEWTRNTREGTGSLHGGLCTENLIQGLCRHIMVDQMLQIEDEGFKVAFTCHDEIVVVAKEQDADRTLARMVEIMSSPPDWAAGMPLGCEGNTGFRYSEAK